MLPDVYDPMKHEQDPKGLLYATPNDFNGYRFNPYMCTY